MPKVDFGYNAKAARSAKELASQQNFQTAANITFAL